MFSLVARRLLVLSCLAAMASPAVGQIAPAADVSPATPRLGPATVTRYRTGAVVTASRGGVRNIKAMVAAPLECREQTVQTIEEDISPTVTQFDYRLLPGDGARQMLIFAPQLRNRDVARAVITYEVVTHTILPPKDPTLLQLPGRRDRVTKLYTGHSPYIDVNHRKIRKALTEALAALEAPDEPTDEATADNDSADDDPADDVAADAEDKAVEVEVVAGTPDADGAESNDDEPAAPEQAEPNDWQRVEAIYDYVIDNVEYKEGIDKSSVQVLKEGVGDCQAIGALFVAMCRTAKVPARLVWVHDHQYAEFYLVDDQGNGHWFPVETAGTPAFGEMRIARVILQKGDNFRVPERRGERLRYASDFLTGLPTPGGGKPSVKYIREQL